MSLRFSSLRLGDRIKLGRVLLEVRETFCREDGRGPDCGKCWFFENSYASFRCSTVDCCSNQYREEYVEFVEIEKGGKE